MRRRSLCFGFLSSILVAADELSTPSPKITFLPTIINASNVSGDLSKCISSFWKSVFHSARKDDGEDGADDDDCLHSWYDVTTGVQDPGLQQVLQGRTGYVVIVSSKAKMAIEFQGSGIEVDGVSLPIPSFGNAASGVVTLDGTPHAPAAEFQNSQNAPAPLQLQISQSNSITHNVTIAFNDNTRAVVLVSSVRITPLPSGGGGPPVVSSPPVPIETSSAPIVTPSTPPLSHPSLSISTKTSSPYLSSLSADTMPQETATLDHNATSRDDTATFPGSSTPSVTANPQASMGHTRSLQIAYIVLAVLAGIAALCLLLCVFSRRRRRSHVDVPAIGVKETSSMIFSLSEEADAVSPMPPSQRTSQVLAPYPLARPASRTLKRTSVPYAFSRPGSSIASSHDPPVPRIPGISPYTFERAISYPESSTDDSMSHMERDFDTFVPPVPDLPPGAKFISTATAPASVPLAQPVMIDLEGGPSNTILPTGGAADPALVRQITFTTKGRVLRVQNPDYRSNASTAGDHETVSLS